MSKFKEYLILKGYAATSMDTILKSVDYFFRWAEKENIGELSTITHRDIIAYIQYFNTRGTGKKTIAHYLMHLGKYFDFLGQQGQVSENPCHHIKVKGIQRKVLHHILSMTEMEDVLHRYPTEITLNTSLKNPPPQQRQTLARKRNKVILGLLVYQGLRTQEIMRLQVSDVKLREGKIFIPSARRSSERTLSLAAHQLMELLDYINDTRKQILALRQGTLPVQELCLSMGEGKNKSSLFSALLRHLQQLHPGVKSLEQIRASVIVHWLKLYNLRKVQVMAGHRYISSTESYQASDLDALKEDISKYHPF